MSEWHMHATRQTKKHREKQRTTHVYTFMENSTCNPGCCSQITKLNKQQQQHAHTAADTAALHGKPKSKKRKNMKNYKV